MDRSRTIVIECMRYDPETDAAPRYQAYDVAYTDDMSVLQGLQYIKDHLDGSLTFRWSCRMAVCGSCGMMLNGTPSLSCETFLRDFDPPRVRVEPLAHFPIERDLIVDVGEFVRKLESVKPYIIPKEARKLSDGEYLQTPRQMDEYYQYAQCINCLLCYAACPQYGLTPGFVGPGALALLHRYNADSRDAGRAQRMEVVNAEEGVWSCTLVGYCSEVCPKGVDPARAVNQNKINSTKDYFLRWLAPRRGRGG
jgi:fumarate reductase iron-sulfur subunit